jgi:hypothetical protein
VGIVKDCIADTIITKNAVEHGLEELWVGIIGGIRTPLDHKAGRSLDGNTKRISF